MNLTPPGAFAQEEPLEEEVEEPIEDPVMTIIRQRVDAYKHSVGMAVGVISGVERLSYTYGTLNRSTIRKVAKTAVYEIGSISSIMTSVLLAHMVQKGEVSLSDPVSKFLPPSVQMPTWNGQVITLEHLATHTSGLPHLPDNITSTDPKNPLAGYTVQQMYDYLSSGTAPISAPPSSIPDSLPSPVSVPDSIMASPDILPTSPLTQDMGTPSVPDSMMSPPVISPTPSLTQDMGIPSVPDSMVSPSATPPSNILVQGIGTGYLHSDLGMVLLAHVLSLKTGQSYEEMLIEQILDPLKMLYTRLNPTLSMKTQTATGHDISRMPVEPSEMPLLPGADGLKSTVHDLSIFVSASMGVIYALPTFETRADSVALASAFDMTTNISHIIENIAMGWRVRKYGKKEIYWQYGVTRGFYSFMGFDKRERLAVVVLSNTANGINDIGFHLLDPEFPLMPPPKLAHNVRDFMQLDILTGIYEFAPGVSVSIFREGSKLYGQPTGQSKDELLPQSDLEFYLKKEDVQVKFVKNQLGQITHLLFLKNGQLHRANKLQAVQDTEYTEPPLDPFEPMEQ